MAVRSRRACRCSITALSNLHGDCRNDEDAGGTGKWLLRQVLHRYVPRHIMERPKMGFGIPLGDGCADLYATGRKTLLSEQRLREAGLLDAAIVRRFWHEHLSGHRNWQYLIWDVLMSTWRERWA